MNVGDGDLASGADKDGAAVMTWLLEGDPSIKWQVLADLVGAPQEEVNAERALLLLHWLGLPRGDTRAMAGCRQVWDGARFFDGGLTLTKTIRQPETCITAMLILLASSFGLGDDRLDPAVQWLCNQQLADGGWNCESVRRGSKHGSFNTSISALDALVQYERSGVGFRYRASWTAVARSSSTTSSTARIALGRW
jgi:hypothetical protein